MASIALEGVSKVFPDGTRAVDGLDLEIPDGEFTILVGPSGSGQVDGAADGRRVGGRIGRLDHDRHAGGQRRRPARPRHRDGLPVLRAVPAHERGGEHGLCLEAGAQDKGSIASRVGRAASRLGIGELLERRPKALSGGQRQRVALGRAIVRSPAAFLMDEPLSNLDAKLRVEMRAYIARLHQELGTTTLVRHPRPDRGHDHGRPRGRDARRPAGAGRLAAAAVRAARRTCSSRASSGRRR